MVIHRTIHDYCFRDYNNWIVFLRVNKTIGLTCQERQIEIYVDEEYLGRDLVYYTVPKGREYIEVSCRDNGMEVYHRRINVKDRNGKLEFNL